MTIDLGDQGHLLHAILIMWGYMSKSTSCDQYFISFIKSNLIYLSLLLKTISLPLPVLNLNLHIMSANLIRLISFKGPWL